MNGHLNPFILAFAFATHDIMAGLTSPTPRMHYLDHAATTPCLVAAAMAPYWDDSYGNAGSLHSMGFTARKAVDGVQAILQNAFNSQGHWVFTSGATESNHLVLASVLSQPHIHKHLVISGFEHDALAVPARHLCHQHGWQLTELPVEPHTGRIQPDALDTVLTAHPAALVSLIHGHNEVGTLQPIGELARTAKQHHALFHTDAAQTAGKCPIDLANDWTDVDYMTLSAHKCYGPKGIGALYTSPSAPALVAQLTGGGQQQGLRGGTEPVPLIVGLGAAVNDSLAWYQANALDAMVSDLRDRVLAAIPQALWNGPWQPADRVPGHAHFSFPGLGGDALVNQLGLQGFAVSSGSACHSQQIQPSAAVLALGRDSAASLGTLRISMGRHTTYEVVNALADAIITTATRLYHRKK